MPNLQRRYFPSNAVLRSFESAARLESFTLAAEEQHLTQSAISRQVKEMEQIIGVELFHRAGRGVVLTDAGRSFSKEIAIDLENTRRTIMRAVSAGKSGAALRVATLPTFASRWLIPRLPDFYSKNPNIEVNLSTRLKPFDMFAENFDLAVHFGKEDWPGTDMTFLCDENLVPIASPAFVREYGLENTADIALAPLLHLATRPFAWQEFLENEGCTNLPVLAGKYFDQFSMIISAAIASLGVGLIPEYLIETELENGTLVALSSSGMKTSNGYFLVIPTGKNNPHVTSLSDWIRDCLQTSEV